MSDAGLASLIGALGLLGVALLGLLTAVLRQQGRQLRRSQHVAGLIQQLLDERSGDTDQDQAGDVLAAPVWTPPQRQHPRHRRATNTTPRDGKVDT